MCKRKNEDSQMKREEYERQMLYCDQDSIINTNLNTTTIHHWNNSNVNNDSFGTNNGLSYEHASKAQLFGRQFVRANRRSMNVNLSVNVHQANSNYSAQGGY